MLLVSVAPGATSQKNARQKRERANTTRQTYVLLSSFSFHSTVRFFSCFFFFFLLSFCLSFFLCFLFSPLLHFNEVSVLMAKRRRARACVYSGENKQTNKRTSTTIFTFSLDYYYNSFYQYCSSDHNYRIGNDKAKTVTYQRHRYFSRRTKLK